MKEGVHVDRRVFVIEPPVQIDVRIRRLPDECIAQARLEILDGVPSRIFSQEFLLIFVAEMIDLGIILVDRVAEQEFNIAAVQFCVTHALELRFVARVSPKIVNDRRHIRQRYDFPVSFLRYEVFLHRTDLGINSAECKQTVLHSFASRIRPTISSARKSACSA